MELDYQIKKMPRSYCRGDLPLPFPTVVAIGNFDGVHKGHQVLLHQLVAEGKARGAVPLVFTFTENPKVLYFGAKYLSGEADRLEALASLGVEAVYEADYNYLHDFSCEEFVREFLIARMDCRAAVIGSDFRFGKGRMGDCRTMQTLMQENGREGIVIPPVRIDGQEVSSTYIRRCLGEGNLAEVERLLGRSYSVLLPVREGRKLGRQFGFPTINQLPSDDRQLPRFGVYASIAEFGGRSFRGITNVGIKPTVSSESKPIFETHLLDFEEELPLYGVQVKVTLLRFLRKERCFPSVEALREQVEKDIKSVAGTPAK